MEVEDFVELIFEFWEDYICNFFDYIFMCLVFFYEIVWIGVGVLFIEIEYGWLNIYYGVYYINFGNEYMVCVLLYDLDNLWIEIV